MRLDLLSLLTTLALLVLNLATTTRFAADPGALDGWRWPYLAASIALTAIVALRPSTFRFRLAPWLPRTTVVVGFAILAGMLLIDWLPPASWSLAPFTDDWPPRFQSTLEGVHLLRHGAFVGWRWDLLGGYATATDITQSMTLLGALPMMLFGDAVGFHLLHIVLFLAVPALVFVDLDRSESRALSLTAAGLVALSTAGMGWAWVRSGDTNSLAGLVCVAAVLVASRRASDGTRYGFTMLVLALAAAAYSHIGFFAYAIGLLVLEAIYYREARHVHRCAIAAILALAISLPLTYELFRYPAEFRFNNVIYQPGAIDWARMIRTIGYNIQILFLPWRWRNDPGALTILFAPLVLLAAWRRDGRAGYYAWAAIFAMAIIRLNVPEAGYLFARPVHLLVIFTPVVIAWFATTRAWDRWVATGITVVAALCFQIVPATLPHEPSAAAFAPELVQHVKAIDEPVVLLENNPHRDVDASPTARSERSLYGTHYEAMLPPVTGKRFYAGFWDGWQWTPFRGEMLASGAWEGHMLTNDDEAPFVAEMRRWGVRHLFVWSVQTKSVLDKWPEFSQQWTNEPWREYELVTMPIDTRSVVTDHGHGELTSTDQLGGVVRLTDVVQGDKVVVRTHFHPAWRVVAIGRDVAAINTNGQLGFVAPAAGTYDVALIYPARRWLLLLSLALILACVLYDQHWGTG